MTEPGEDLIRSAALDVSIEWQQFLEPQYLTEIQAQRQPTPLEVAVHDVLALNSDARRLFIETTEFQRDVQELYGHYREGPSLCPVTIRRLINPNGTLSEVHVLGASNLGDLFSTSDGQLFKDHGPYQHEPDGKELEMTIERIRKAVYYPRSNETRLPD